MLEVNGKLYLKEPGNNKKDEFDLIKSVIAAYLDMLRSHINTL